MGFTGVAGQRIQHRERIETGSAGFDVIVGNPPYVRQETLKALKPYLKATFQTHDSTNDLYVYFQEIEVRNLRAQGRMGMIVANKWMRSGYGESLRGYLRRVAQPLEVIDFGHSPIFPDADTFPCVLLVGQAGPSPIAARATTPEGEELVACQVPRNIWSSNMDLIAYVNTSHHLIPTSLLRDEGWSLENPRIQELLEKIRTTGIPLKEYCRGDMYRGPVSGFNEAFYIDADARKRLIEEDGRSEEIIRPLLRGRDVDRWTTRSSDLYIILARRGINIERYPAILRHLGQFRDRLDPKPDSWDERNGKWGGRKAGDYKWYELQDSVAQELVDACNSEKLVWQDLAWFSEFALDRQQLLPNNTVHLAVTGDRNLLAVLNSPVMWWYMWRTAQHGKDEVLRLFADFVVTLPIPTFPASSETLVQELVQAVLQNEKRVQTFEAELAGEALSKFSTSEPSGKLTAWLPLTSEEYSKRLLKLVGTKRPNSKLVDDVVVFHQKHRNRQVELLTRQLELERNLAALVEAAYGLTPEERVLLRSTRPVRDPLDVLEAKIRGGVIVEEATEDV